MKTETRDQQGRLGGVDSIRAVCSFFVLLGHLSLFSPRAQLSSHILVLMSRASAAMWNGPAAVIVFFLISGFCIHLPFRGSRPLLIGPFMSRRILRVGVPAALALALAQVLLHSAWILWGVLWSVICELIYYILYPVIRPLAKRIGWPTFFLVTYVVSVILCVTHIPELRFAENGYEALGARYTWLIGLPCWLLGCWLAENEKSFPLISPQKMWAMRFGIYTLSVGLAIIKFHVFASLSSNCLTLNLFAPVACAWLGFEIAYYKAHEPWAVLEWAGKFSYSLYLTHPLVWLTLAGLHWHWLYATARSLHGVMLVFAVVLAYLFYLAIERPSHLFAVMVSRKVAKLEKPVYPGLDRAA